MPGHLFITRGDLTALACDAVLVPAGTDPAGEDPRPHLASHWAEVPGLAQHLEGEFLRPPTGEDWRVRPLTTGTIWPEPEIWVGNTARDFRHSPSDLADVVVEFITEAAREIHPRTSRSGARRPLNDDRPLVAFPLVGSGQGFHTGKKGEVVKEIVQRAAAVLAREEVNADAILVVKDAAAYAAAQQARSRYASTTSTLGGAQLDRLVEQARSGRLVLFLGAGASIGAGLPSWSDLLDALTATILGDRRPSAEQLKGVDVRDVATLLEKESPADFRDLVVEEVTRQTGASLRVSLLHQLLASLPAHEAVTTNYDLLFETAWAAAGRTPDVLPGTGQVLGRDWLLKLHGSVDRREAIVLSRGDYLRFEREGSALAGLVHAALLTRHLLFVGYSLRDDNFHRIVHQVRDLQPNAPEASGADGTAVLGTVITPDDPDVMRRIWEPEIQIVSTRAHGDSAIRQQAIVLDALAAEASPPGRHLLDATYDAVFNPAERDLRDHLKKLLELVDRQPLGDEKPIRVALQDEVRSALARFRDDPVPAPPRPLT